MKHGWHGLKEGLDYVTVSPRREDKMIALCRCVQQYSYRELGRLQTQSPFSAQVFRRLVGNTA